MIHVTLLNSAFVFLSHVNFTFSPAAAKRLADEGITTLEGIMCR